jgi:hypothetical protein
MKQLFILALAFSQLFSSSTEEVVINKQTFSVVKESYSIYDSKGQYVKFYRVEKEKEPTSVLRLTLNDATGNCASKSLEDGAYEIDGDSITFYTLWNRRGKAYFEPYGAKIIRYKVLDNGTLKEVSSQIYIEATRKKYDDGSGMEFLFHAPKTQEEKALLTEYVSSMEDQYKGKFLFGKEHKALIKSVKEALKRKTKQMWKH